MIRLLKYFALFIYWCIALQLAQFLLNFPMDTSFYAGIFVLSISIYLTIYLIKHKKLL